MLFLMLVLTVFTAVQRFMKVWHQASVDRPTPSKRPRRDRRSSRRGPRLTGVNRSQSSWQRRPRKTD
jgi:hypothetical protein